ncbi:TetR family transcriptional regulator [Paraburkholderia graminis]|jgi:TetR/AcrR family transcriptional repressor of nem operon|uniref:TetR/AcrR family transcriptional repressor of nem operon n=1 Tax=Paraburkholderia graminis TaxID=60548 RepID=A0ABD5CLH2_9BURK|nr:TetR family transcriptional regulator [Paraburkholderia graminis]AXF10461.1 TetR family transcriptional regulator [Paraburkholderia graminis]MBW8834501.1 TetR/AcrR family transcriptional regulator [Burkholderia sp.]MDQ0624940.1 TetR/AcrR family transcriptional repressor of nem operon [Paraburkholderia graminis]MDR6206095.1 TetR/AcrR family transcriptional repressor of nem operon [Paraburkholderia graminis]
MKVTKAQAQANRARIVETAATLFRERGYDGVGVADLMAAAGFTHGGFYKHFGSKADLMAEAAACGFSESAAGSEGIDIAAFIKQYLSREHRDTPGTGCTMAALSVDAGRQPEQVKQAFADGIERLLMSMVSKHGASGASGATNATSAAAKREARARSIDAIAQLVGAVVLSRACPDDSPLADEILQACESGALSRLSAPKKKP